MSTQAEKASEFNALHVKGQPVILFNIWDAGSAAAVAGAGANAIATGSAPVAMAQGFDDGENFPLEAALENARRIVAAVDVPVTMDFEGGYAVNPAGVAENVTRVLETGVVGFNFEDQVVGTSDLYDIGTQVARIRAVRAACDSAGVPGFVNARTDLFLKAAPETHNAAMLGEAILRAAAYAEAGASGFFAPGLRDAEMIRRLCDEVTLPLNIIALPGAPENRVLAALGVARISYGPVPYKRMIGWLGAAAAEALESVG